jgi:hypothetical protein
MVGVDYLVLADAVAAVGGKHYIHGGGWDTLYAGAFPVVHPSMGIAVRLRVPWNDTNRPCVFELDVLDADGRTILPDPPGPIRGTVNLGRPPHLPIGDDQVVPLALGLNSLRFETPGLYVIVCRLDGVEAARAPFRVSQQTQVTGGAQG